MKRVFSSEVSQYIGSEVTVAGWVATVRSHGKLLFIDLRDMMGQVQIVFGPKHSKDIFDLANTMRPEWVIQVVGHVQKRPEGMENPGIPTPCEVSQLRDWRVAGCFEPCLGGFGLGKGVHYMIS